MYRQQIYIDKNSIKLIKNKKCPFAHLIYIYIVYACKWTFPKTHIFTE